METADFMVYGRCREPDPALWGTGTKSRGHYADDADLVPEGIGTRQAGNTKTVQYDSADRRVFSERTGKEPDSGFAVGL